MNIPETLLKLPEKELKKILSEENIYKAKYVIRNGNIYEVESKHKGIVFMNKGQMSVIRDFSFNYLPLSLNVLNEIKRNELANSINTWSYEQWFNWCAKQFINSYGEEFVDYGDSPYITVHFPEITISNSMEQSHIIRDLYLRFNVGNNGITIYGLKRGTLTDSELRNCYTFSHVNNGGYLFDWADTFCFGETQISELRSYIRKNRKNAFRSLSFFLEAIKEYLSWESLEGVPYKKIDDVIYDKQLWREVHKSATNEMVSYVLTNLESFTYTFESNNEEYYVALDSTSREVISNMLREKYPEHCDLYLEGRSVEKRNVVQNNYGDRYVTFKGQNRPFTLINTVDVNIELPKRINATVLDQVCNTINSRFNKFLKQKKINEYSNEN